MFGLKIDQGKSGELVVAFESRVEVGHVGIVVLSVVNFHRPCVDVWFKSVVSISQLRE